MRFYPRSAFQIYHRERWVRRENFMCRLLPWKKECGKGLYPLRSPWTLRLINQTMTIKVSANSTGYFELDIDTEGRIFDYRGGGDRKGSWDSICGRYACVHANAFPFPFPFPSRQSNTFTKENSQTISYTRRWFRSDWMYSDSSSNNSYYETEKALTSEREFINITERLIYTLHKSYRWVDKMLTKIGIRGCDLAQRSGAKMSYTEKLIYPSTNLIDGLIKC